MPVWTFTHMRYTIMQNINKKKKTFKTNWRIKLGFQGNNFTLAIASEIVF